LCANCLTFKLIGHESKQIIRAVPVEKGQNQQQGTLPNLLQDNLSEKA
jgi:hypothetical protein